MNWLTRCVLNNFFAFKCIITRIIVDTVCYILLWLNIRWVFVLCIVHRTWLIKEMLLKIIIMISLLGIFISTSWVSISSISHQKLMSCRGMWLSWVRCFYVPLLMVFGFWWWSKELVTLLLLLRLGGRRWEEMARWRVFICVQLRTCCWTSFSGCSLRDILTWYCTSSW